MSNFHERIKELKDASGKTQAQIAESLSITPQNLSYYFNGREPHFELLIKIAKYFDVSVEYLLGISDIKKLERINPVIENIINHHAYSKEVENILNNLESYLYASDIECEKIEQMDASKKIEERYGILGKIEYVFLPEKQTAIDKLKSIKNKIIKDIDHIEENTLEYIEDKLREYENKFLKEAKATVEEE